MGSQLLLGVNCDIEPLLQFNPIYILTPPRALVDIRLQQSSLPDLGCFHKQLPAQQRRLTGIITRIFSTASSPAGNSPTNCMLSIGSKLELLVLYVLD
jgi:hypothetical protein